MAVKSRAVTVTTTATRLDTTDETDWDNMPSTAHRRLSAFVAYNNGAASVFIGGSDVTTANGYPVAASTSTPGVDLDEEEGVWGIVASGTVEMRVFEAGV